MRLNVLPLDVDRIARDRPDILARMKAGEFAYVRQAAIAAGIIAVGDRCPGTGCGSQRLSRSEPQPLLAPGA